MFGAAPAEGMCLQGGSQATEGWSTMTTKKRKLQTPGRPVGTISKAKTIDREANQSIFSFASQPPQQKQRWAQARRLRLRLQLLSQLSTRRWTVILHQSDARHEG